MIDELRIPILHFCKYFFCKISFRFKMCCYSTQTYYNAFPTNSCLFIIHSTYLIITLQTASRRGGGNDFMMTVKCPWTKKCVGGGQKILKITWRHIWTIPYLTYSNSLFQHHRISSVVWVESEQDRVGHGGVRERGVLAPSPWRHHGIHIHVVGSLSKNTSVS